MKKINECVKQYPGRILIHGFAILLSVFFCSAEAVNIYTGEEVQRWKSRIQSGQWKNEDYLNKKNQWVRNFFSVADNIEAKKNAFVSKGSGFGSYPGPQAGNREYNCSIPIKNDKGETVGFRDEKRSSYWNGEGAIPTWLPDPHVVWGQKMLELNAASFWSATHDDAALDALVKKAILDQVRNPGVQWEASRWKPDGVFTKNCPLPHQRKDYTWQTNPFFFMAEWQLSIAKNYAMVRHLFSTDEQDEIHQWLVRGAAYFRGNLKSLEKYFDSVSERNQQVFNTKIEGWEGDYFNQKLFDNLGYITPAASVRWNNRALSQGYAIGIMGLVSGNSADIQFGENIFKEWLMFSVLEDGTMLECHRSKEACTHYSGVVLAQMLELAIAHHHVKGGRQLLDWKTHKGIACAKLSLDPDDKRCATSTTAPTRPKNLLDTVIAYSRYFRGADEGGWSPRRLSGGQPVDGFISSTEVINGLHDIWVQHGMYVGALAARYYTQKADALWAFAEFNQSRGYAGWKRWDIYPMSFAQTPRGIYGSNVDIALTTFRDKADILTTAESCDASQPLSAEAGNNQHILLSDSIVTLAGQGSGCNIAFAWTQISGPVSTTINSPSSASAQVSGLSAVGDYHFRLSVSNDVSSVSDEVIITVNSNQTRIEAESVPVARQEAGTASIRTAGFPSEYGQLGGVILPDVNDALVFPVHVAASGQYRIKIRLRSGHGNNPSSYFSGYTFYLNDDALQVNPVFDAISPQYNDTPVGALYWGTMITDSLQLTKGTYYLKAEAKYHYGVVDFVEITN